MNRLHEGFVLGDRYELTRRIASGGMADVWEAVDTTLSRTVAVKVMRPDSDTEHVFAQRFRDEALHTAGLSHPNIATVFDYDECDGLAYLVMELVAGEPLSALLARVGTIDPVLTRSIIGQAALALGAAHDAGVVHRDIKPANMMITPTGTVKLTDFGIARAVDAAGHTRTGEILGTPHYLSPEQALGEAATGASDIYALGVVAHEMLTGARPFDKGTPVATALAQVNEAPPELPADTPADLAEIITACLDKDPAARPQRARALGELLGQQPPPAVPEPPVERPASEVVGDAALRERARTAEAAEGQPETARIAPPTPPSTQPPASPSVAAGDAQATADPHPAARPATPSPARPATPSPSVTAGDAQATADPHPSVEATRGRVHWGWVPTVAVLAALVALLLQRLVG